MDSDDDSINENRTRPNILLTGTPGVGKTSTAIRLAEALGLKHLHLGDLIRQHHFTEAHDEARNTDILDEDKLLDYLEPFMTTDGGIVLDYHACELFPERWFDLVLVLRASTEVLYDRLTARQYSDTKRWENLECEILQVVLDEAREAYDPNIVVEVPSNTVEDMEATLARVKIWMEQWMQDRASSSK